MSELRYNHFISQGLEKFGFFLRVQYIVSSNKIFLLSECLSLHILLQKDNPLNPRVNNGVPNGDFSLLW